MRDCSVEGPRGAKLGVSGRGEGGAVGEDGREAPLPLPALLLVPGGRLISRKPRGADLPATRRVASPRVSHSPCWLLPHRG
jgi:hypothetical protein